jgi:hypothetical protein
MTAKEKGQKATSGRQSNKSVLNDSTTNGDKKQNTGHKFVTGEAIRARFQESAKALWTVEGVLPESSGLTCIYGQYGSFKSFLAFDLVSCIATGKPYHGRKVKQSPILYVCAEGGDGFWKRVIAWHNWHELDQIGDNITVYDGAVNLNSATDRENFKEDIKLLPQQPKIIVFDTLARCFGGKEENNENMSAFVSICDAIGRDIGCKVIIVHHSGKDPSKGARGGSSLPAAVDTEICITCASDNTAKLSFIKQKNFEKGAPLRFKMQKVVTGEKDADGHEIDSLIPELLTTEGQAPEILTENGKLALSALEAAGGHNVTSDKWRKTFDTLRPSGSSDESNKRAYYRGKDELAQKQMLVTSGNMFSIALQKLLVTSDKPVTNR